MKLYTLNLTIEELCTEVEINDYVRGVFTTLNKATEVAEQTMRENEDIKEVFIMEYTADQYSSGVAVVGWLQSDDGYFKYFERVNGKFVTYEKEETDLEHDLLFGKVCGEPWDI